MFQFEHPLVAVLFAIPPIIYLLFSSPEADKAGLPTINNPNIKWFSKAFGKRGDFSSQKSRFNYYLFIIWCLLTLTLMHPQTIEKVTKVSAKGYDIILGIDLSRSMSALDLSDKSKENTRLDVVKKIASSFINERDGDRVGIVLFGQNAYLQSPLTLDNALAVQMLNLSQIGIAGDATAIGDALALSIKTLSTRPENSRIIILLTDGTNTAGVINPMEAAQMASKFGIKVHTIAVGKDGIIPMKTESGDIVYAQSEVDETLLTEMARVTGGTFSRAEDKVNLEKIYKKIDEMEKTESETREIIIRDQLYIYPLYFALALLLLRVLYNYKWSKFLLNE